MITFDFIDIYALAFNFLLWNTPVLVTSKCTENVIQSQVLQLFYEKYTNIIWKIIQNYIHWKSRTLGKIHEIKIISFWQHMIWFLSAHISKQSKMTRQDWLRTMLLYECDLKNISRVASRINKKQYGTN